MYKNVYPGMDDADLLYKKIKTDFFSRKLNHQEFVIKLTKPTSEELLNEVTIHGAIKPAQFHRTDGVKDVIYQSTN